MSIKVESRGKYPGVKLHLEAEEVQMLLEGTPVPANPVMHQALVDTEPCWGLLYKMGKKIRALQEETPGLLDERTPEQVKAILVKEVEKAAMQLKMVEAGQDPSKVDKDKLKEALLKYVKD